MSHNCHQVIPVFSLQFTFQWSCHNSRNRHKLLCVCICMCVWGGVVGGWGERGVYDISIGSFLKCTPKFAESAYFIWLSGASSLSAHLSHASSRLSFNNDVCAASEMLSQKWQRSFLQPFPPNIPLEYVRNKAISSTLILSFKTLAALCLSDQQCFENLPQFISPDHLKLQVGLVYAPDGLKLHPQFQKSWGIVKTVN